MKSERREFKEFSEFREISENQLDCSVIFGFLGFREYPRRGYKEKRDMGLSNLFEQNISLFYL